MVGTVEIFKAQRARNTLLAAFVFTAMLAWVAVPIALYVLLTTQQRTISVTPEIDTWVPIEASDAPTLREVSLHVAWSEGEEVYAPDWVGLVESVETSVGQALSSGQVVAVVGGIQRIAVHTERPFARQLTTDDRGADVAALNAFLASRGVEHGEADRFNWLTLMGVRALAESIGVPDAEQVMFFDQSWLLYLPVAEISVAATALRVGAPAPSSGDVIVTGEERIVAARIREASDGFEKSETDGQDSEATLKARVQAEAEEKLLVGGQELPLSEMRDEVDLASLQLLSSLIEPSSSLVVAMLEKPPVLGQWMVPSASILSGADGHACVVIRTSELPLVTRVTVAGQSPGLTVVSGEMSASNEALVAPNAKKYSCV